MELTDICGIFAKAFRADHGSLLPNELDADHFVPELPVSGPVQEHSCPKPVRLDAGYVRQGRNRISCTGREVAQIDAKIRQ